MYHSTYCRLCEAGCGLTVEVEDHKLVRIAPDRHHPLSQGFACRKGLALGVLQAHPERLTQPYVNRGSYQQPAFAPCSWKDALGDMARRLRHLRRQYGPQSIAMYMGNPSAFSLATSIFAVAFMRALGSPRQYSAASIDCAERFYVARRMLGHELFISIPDVEQTDYAILIGGNPLVSQWSQLGTIPRWHRMLRQRRRQGARFVVVDPRRTETAAIADHHVRLRPNRDPFLLFAMLQHILAHHLYDAVYVERYCQGLETVRDVMRPYTPAWAARHTGVAAETIRRLAEEFAAAPRGFIVGHSGVTMTPYGSLTEWAILTLNAITGNIDRPGGLYFNHGLIDPVRLQGLAAPSRLSHTAEGFARVLDSDPCCRLADAIETNDSDRVRALIIVAGNPLRSFPQPQRLRRALPRLDLLVSIDLVHNESAAGADYLLPVTTMLEREDIVLLNTGLQHRPFVQYTPAILTPPPHVREEWQIFRALARRCTVPSGYPLRGVWSRWLWALVLQLHPRCILRLLLALWGRVGLATIQRHPHGLVLGEREFGWFVPHRLRTPHHRIVLDVPEFIQAGRRLSEDVQLDAELYPWQVISRRRARSMNTWFDRFMDTGNGPDTPLAEVNHDAARALGFAEGERVRVRSRVGHLIVHLHLTNTVAPGVVVLPQGCTFRSAGQSDGCMNDLIDDRRVEPFTGVPRFNGTAVRLEAVA